MIKELKSLRKDLDKIIHESENSKTIEDVMEIERTAFKKFQTYIAWAISFRKQKIATYSTKCKERDDLQFELKQYLFIEKNIIGFIDAELTPNRNLLINN